MIEAAIYFLIGMAMLAFMVVHDVFHGRGVQRRDFHLVFFWPIIVPVVVVLGLISFSDITSSENGKDLGNPGKWL